MTSEFDSKFESVTCFVFFNCFSSCFEKCLNDLTTTNKKKILAKLPGGFFVLSLTSAKILVSNRMLNLPSRNYVSQFLLIRSISEFWILIIETEMRNDTHSGTKLTHTKKNIKPQYSALSDKFIKPCIFLSFSLDFPQ